MESLAVLEENMVMAGLVHRDFENEVAAFGDVVNTRRPGTFKSYRKTDADDISLQDASAANVQVPLNQHFYVSFIIKDGEASKSFKDLVSTYLAPGMQGVARGIDRMLCGQSQRFLANKVGKLGGVSASTSKNYLLEVREKMNVNLAYPQDRRLVLSPAAETLLLQTDMFVKANERGDGGRALEEARLGRVLGFDTFMDQNALGIASADSVAGAVGADYGVGEAGSMTVAITGHEVTVGEYVVCEDNGQPTVATAATVGGGNTTAVTLDEALKYAVANTSVVAAYPKCATDGATPAGYSKGIIVDGYSVAPQVGQIVAFGTGGARHTYSIIEAYVNPANGAQTILWLDRPLTALVADGADVFPGPCGAMGLAFHRDAIALVTRPLVLPPSTEGVRSAVSVYNDVAMRVAFQYDIKSQGTIVTLDMLAGVAVLDENLACVLLT